MADASKPAWSTHAVNRFAQRRQTQQPLYPITTCTLPPSRRLDHRPIRKLFFGCWMDSVLKEFSNRDAGLRRRAAWPI